MPQSISLIRHERPSPRSPFHLPVTKMLVKSFTFCMAYCPARWFVPRTSRPSSSCYLAKAKLAYLACSMDTRCLTPLGKACLLMSAQFVRHTRNVTSRSRRRLTWSSIYHAPNAHETIQFHAQCLLRNWYATNQNLTTPRIPATPST